MNLFIQSGATRNLIELSGFNKLVRGIVNAGECRNYFSGAIYVKNIFRGTLHYCQIVNLLVGALVVTLGVCYLFYMINRKDTSRMVALKRSKDKLNGLKYSRTIFLLFTLSGYTFAAVTTLPRISGLVEVLQSSMMLTMAVGIFAYGCRIVNHRYRLIKTDEKSLLSSLLHMINYLLIPRSRLALFSFILGATACRLLNR